MPTSRATRVTSSANDESWSTIVLIVSLSSRISPRASTVIFWLRSPVATAVVTAAIWRTWFVRFDAIELTFSVRSRQVPQTPLTCAWPPSLPSVPTSRATRVTSSANEPSWSTISLTVVPIAENSPLTGWPSIVSAIFWLRSPVATDWMTREISIVGRTRSSIIALTDSTVSLHVPSTVPSDTRSVMRPSRPMTRETRASSFAWRRVQRDELVAALLHVADDVAPARAQAHGEVAVAGGGQDAQDLLERLLVARAERGAVRPRRCTPSCSCRGVRRPRPGPRCRRAGRDGRSPPRASGRRRVPASRGSAVRRADVRRSRGSSVAARSSRDVVARGPAHIRGRQVTHPRACRFPAARDSPTRGARIPIAALRHLLRCDSAADPVASRAGCTTLTRTATRTARTRSGTSLAPGVRPRRSTVSRAVRGGRSTRSRAIRRVTGGSDSLEPASARRRGR